MSVPMDEAFEDREQRAGVEIGMAAIECRSAAARLVKALDSGVLLVDPDKLRGMVANGREALEMSNDDEHEALYAIVHELEDLLK